MEVEDRRSPAEVEPDRCGQLDVHLSPGEDSKGKYQILLLHVAFRKKKPLSLSLHYFIHNYTYIKQSFFSLRLRYAGLFQMIQMMKPLKPKSQMCLLIWTG